MQSNEESSAKKMMTNAMNEQIGDRVHIHQAFFKSRTRMLVKSKVGQYIIPSC
jgi:hypothetical protein